MKTWQEFDNMKLLNRLKGSAYINEQHPIYICKYMIHKEVY